MPKPVTAGAAWQGDPLVGFHGGGLGGEVCGQVAAVQQVAQQRRDGHGRVGQQRAGADAQGSQRAVEGRVCTRTASGHGTCRRHWQRQPAMPLSTQVQLLCLRSMRVQMLICLPCVCETASKQGNLSSSFLLRKACCAWKPLERMCLVSALRAPCA